MTTRHRQHPIFRFCAAIMVGFMAFGLVTPPPVAAKTSMELPVPGSMVTPSSGFVPPMLRGLKVDLQRPFAFDFILDTGNASLDQQEVREEAGKLIRYFLASLTIPENDLWVNLSPYEGDRIIPTEFGITEMGRDVLAQDYILKQLTASLMYPEEELGKEFWDKVYSRAHQLYGTTDISVNTFVKVWIIPDKALVYEHDDVAYVLESNFKVMLEKDYVALRNNLQKKELGTDQLEEIDVQELSKVSSEVIRDVVIPEIEKEVNTGENFARLRQIYHSLVLAKWYKERLKNSILNQTYSDRRKVNGVDLSDKNAKEKIYQQYVEAFKVGVFDYIKEEFDVTTQEIIPRKYFSGGLELRVPLQITTDAARLANTDPVGKLSWIQGVYRQPRSSPKSVNDFIRSQFRNGNVVVGDPLVLEDGTQRKSYYVSGLLSNMGQLGHIGFVEKNEEGQPIAGGQEVVFFDSQFANDATVRAHEALKVSRWTEKRESLELSPEQMRGWLKDNLEEATQFLQDVDTQAENRYPLEALYDAAEANGQLPTNEQIAATYDTDDDFLDLNIAGGRWGRRDPITQAMLPSDPVLSSISDGESFDDILLKEMAEQRGISVNDLEADFQRTVSMIEDRLQHSGFISPEADISVAKMHEIYTRLVGAYRTMTDEEPGTFQVVDANSVNAFVIRNRPDVYFYKGLYETFAEIAQKLGRPLTEDIIAFVIAHEMGHTLQHTSYLGLDLTDLYTGASPYLIQMIKNAEYDADMQALELMDRAGFSVLGGIDAMSFLEYISRTSQPQEILSSHPYVSLRKNRLTKIVYDQETTVFNNVRAVRLPMPGTGKMATRDADYRLLMDGSIDEIMETIGQAQSIEEVDEALTILINRRGLDAIKSAAAQERVRGAFMEHMFLQAGLTAIETQTKSYLMSIPNKVDFQNMVKAAAATTFGREQDVSSVLSDEKIDGIEIDQAAAIEEVLERTDQRIEGSRTARDRDRRARQLIRALNIAFAEVKNQLTAQNFNNFLLPRSEVEDIIGIFEKSEGDFSNKQIIDSLRDARKLISAFFYANIIDQEPGIEVKVPTTNVQVRLQQRSNDLFLTNPRYRSTTSTEDRQQLQEILLSQYILKRSGAPLGQGTASGWRGLGGIETTVRASTDELRQVFQAYYRVLSQQYIPNIAAEMALDRVEALANTRLRSEDFVRNVLEGEGTLDNLAKMVTEAKERGDSTADVSLMVGLHGVTQFIRTAIAENPDRFNNVNLDETLNEIAEKGMRSGDSLYRVLASVLTGMEVLYNAQPIRPGSASEVFQRETGLNTRTISNSVDSFETLQRLPDWAVSDLLSRDSYRTPRLIQQALDRGTPIAEILDFMSTRLSFADRQSVFSRIFLTSEAITPQVTALLNYLKAEFNNDSREIVLWFLSMFSTRDALNNLVHLASKSLVAQADREGLQQDTDQYNDMAQYILEFAFSQASPTFTANAESADVYLKLIRSGIERADLRGTERTQAIHTAMMKISSGVSLSLKFSQSRAATEGAAPDYRDAETGIVPEMNEGETVKVLSTNVRLHRMGWNSAAEGSAGEMFVTGLTNMSTEQLQGLLAQRLRYLSTQTSVEYREELFTVSGTEDQFSNLITAILFKRLGNVTWGETGSEFDRLNEVLTGQVSYVIDSETQRLRISYTNFTVQINQAEINAIPFDTILTDVVGKVIPSQTLDKIWLTYVQSNQLESRFPEFLTLLQNPNAGIDKSNPIREYLDRRRSGQKVSYRQIIKKFFMGSSAFSELFNAYVKEEGEGYLYGDYRPLADRLAWIEAVLPSKSILKDGILDLWETDAFPEIVGGLDILAQAAQKANAGDSDLWTLLGEMDDDVGRLQRLNSELSVKPDRIDGLLDFYTTIIPQIFSPQKIARYGATAFLLWRQLPESADLGLESQLEALTKFMPEPSLLRDELLTTVASRYIRQLNQADSVSALLYVNNLLARNRDLRSEDFVAETVQHMFGGSKTADKRDMLLWVVGIQEKPPFVTETEDNYGIDFTSLPDDVKLLPGTVRNRFIEGFMLGDNGVLDPRTEEDREIMRDLLNQLFVSVFPEGVEGITETGRQALGRVFQVAMEAYPAYKRVSIIKALADLGFRTDFQLTSLGERLAVLLGVMGPVGIKVAQFLSENDTLIPDASLRASLGSLRHQAPEVPKISAISVLQNEIPFADRLVQEIGDPVGIASIKQVNRGKWIDLVAIAGAISFQVEQSEATLIQSAINEFLQGTRSFEQFAGFVISRADQLGFDMGQATRAVVYKIRRPNMDATLPSDYNALDAVANDLQGQTFQGETISSVDELVATVKEWVELEKDFLNEAEFHSMITDLDYKWAEAFAEEAEVTIAHPRIFFATNSLIVEEEVPGVPMLSLSEEQNPITIKDVLSAGYTMPAARQVFNDLRGATTTRARVLLSLKRAGYPEDELNDLADEVEKFDYARVRSLLRKILLRQIFVDGVFHADMHQGNVLLTPDGRLAMIDRGNVGQLNQDQITGVRALLKGLSLRQSDLIKQGIDAVFLGTQHTDGRESFAAAITQEEIQSILDDGYDLKMTMSVIGARTVQGSTRTQAEQDFSSFLKAFTQAIWLFPTDFNNGLGTLQDIAAYVGMDQDEIVVAAEEQAKYFVAADTTSTPTVGDSDLMQVTKDILAEKLATTRNPFTRLMLQGFVFPLIRRTVRQAEGNQTELAGQFISLIRSMGPRVLRDNIETLAQLRNYELLDAIGELMEVQLAENVASTYVETSLRGRGFGNRSVSLSMPIVRGLLNAARPVTRTYVEIGKEWLERGGKRVIARLAPRMTLGEAIRILSQVFPQDFATIRQEFETYSRKVPPRLTPQQKKIRAVEDVPDIRRTSETDSNNQTGLTTSAITSQDEVGGIDLNPNLLELQIQGDRIELDIPLDTGALEPVQIEGLLPVIINVTPITNLPLILGAIDNEAELYAAATP